jgi:hypothetical protein
MQGYWVGDLLVALREIRCLDLPFLWVCPRTSSLDSLYMSLLVLSFVQAFTNDNVSCRKDMARPEDACHKDLF